jgi:insertion element IS1 protein InsB
LICTDSYEPYTQVIPVGRHYQGKDQTFGVERTNSQQRHWLARFRRRTCVVSRAKRMVEVSIALFARFCVNGSIDDLLALLT